MKSAHTQWRCMAAAVAAATALSACHDGNTVPASAPPSGQTTQNFSSFATKTFEQPANSTPVNFDHVTLVYDVNDDPTAFNALLM